MKDKIKKSLAIGISASLVLLLWTAGAWWLIDSRVVLALWAAAAALITAVTLVILAREKIAEEIREKNRERRKGYISAAAVCAAARWTA